MKCIIQAAKLFAVIIDYYQFTTSKEKLQQITLIMITDECGSVCTHDCRHQQLFFRLIVNLFICTVVIFYHFCHLIDTIIDLLLDAFINCV